jgi:hypothetical protein
MTKKNSIILTLLSSTAFLSAADTSHYLSLTGGYLEYDQPVYGSNNFFDNKYEKIEKESLVGIDYTWLKSVSENEFLIGVSPRILFSDSNFDDGGFLNINFLFGKAFGDFKLYGNIGYGLNSLSDYTISRGNNYGLTARYDLSEHFSAALSYNLFDMRVSTIEFNNPTDDYKVKGLLGTLSFKF